MIAKRAEGPHAIARDVLHVAPDAPGILPLVVAGLLVGTGQSAPVTMAVSDLVGQSAAEMGPDRFLALLRRVGDGQPDGSAILARRVATDSAPAHYRISAPEFVPAPYQTAAIGYDPRRVPFTPEADAVEVRLNEITRAVIKQWEGKVDGLSPQQIGTLLHMQLERAVRAANIPGVLVEHGIAPEGGDARYGEEDSLRTDVIYTNPATGRVEGIWDYKTGTADLSLSRARELADRAGKRVPEGEPEVKVPVIMIKIRIERRP